MRAVKPTTIGLAVAKERQRERIAREEAREKSRLDSSLRSMERRKRSMRPCLDCGRASCWVGATTVALESFPEASCWPKAPPPMTQEEKEEARLRSRQSRRRSHMSWVAALAGFWI
jgi:hypothetical protein